jgi:DNA-binding protein YbaB
MHPAVAAVLKQAEQLQSLMDAQLEKMRTETFIGTDQTETVEVTLDGHQQLTDVHLSDGVLRHGAATVQQRVNEALHNATAAATASIEADRERLDAMVARLTDPDA